MLTYLKLIFGIILKRTQIDIASLALFVFTAAVLGID